MSYAASSFGLSAIYNASAVSSDCSMHDQRRENNSPNGTKHVLRKYNIKLVSRTLSMNDATSFSVGSLPTSSFVVTTTGAASDEESARDASLVAIIDGGKAGVGTNKSFV